MSEWIADDSGLRLADIEKRQAFKFEPRNSLTEWAVKHGCNASDHDGYRAAVARLAGRRREAA